MEALKKLSNIIMTIIGIMLIYYFAKLFLIVIDFLLFPAFMLLGVATIVLIIKNEYRF
jgi:hypothetical protein